MLFDTDILIWVQRGNKKAADLIDRTNDRLISVLSYMELMQYANNKKQHNFIKNFLKDFNFITVPLTENIGHRASVYIEEYSISSGLKAGDAIVAATAVELNLILSSGNVKHLKHINDLQLKPFKP